MASERPDAAARPTRDEAISQLQEAVGLDLLGTPADARFERLTELAAQVFDTAAAAVTFVGDDWTWARAAVGGAPDRVPRLSSFCNVTVADDRALVVHDAAPDGRVTGERAVTGADGIRFYAGYPLHGPDGTAIGALCVFDTRDHDFGPRDEQTLRVLAALVEREITYQDERDRAEQLQRSLLPATAPDFPGYRAAGVCLPSHRVGGDFYDWYVNGDGTRLVATIADVMGKGTPAAILAATVRAVLRAETLRAGMPGAVERTAEDVAADLDATEAFATVLHASFGPGGHVLYSDAGHGLAAVVPADGPPRPLAAGGVPVGLGLHDTDGWSVREVVLAPGETLVAFSDGLLDLTPTPADAVTLAASLARGDLAGLPGRVRAATAARTARTDDITVLAVRHLP